MFTVLRVHQCFFEAPEERHVHRNATLDAPSSSTSDAVPIPSPREGRAG